MTLRRTPQPRSSVASSLPDAGSWAMRAQGYMMDATLEDGLLTVEGRGRTGRFALDWDMSDRMEALEEQVAAEHEQLGDDPSRAEKREQSGRDLQQIRKALGDKTTPRIPVASIDLVKSPTRTPSRTVASRSTSGTRRRSFTSGARQGIRRESLAASRSRSACSARHYRRPDPRGPASGDALPDRENLADPRADLDRAERLVPVLARPAGPSGPRGRAARRGGGA